MWALCKFKVLKKSVWMVSIVTSAVLPARKEMIFPAQPELALCNSFRHRARHDGRERLRLLFVRLDHEVPDVSIPAQIEGVVEKAVRSTKVAIAVAVSQLVRCDVPAHLADLHYAKSRHAQQHNEVGNKEYDEATCLW